MRRLASPRRQREPARARDANRAIVGRTIRYTDRFDDPNLPGVMAVTVNLRPVVCGTELDVTQDGIPDVIPLEMCHLGWQESLASLARLVEPDIKE